MDVTPGKTADSADSRPPVQRLRATLGLSLMLGAFALLACATTVPPRSANPYQAAQQETLNRESRSAAEVNLSVPLAVAQGVNRRADGQCYTVCGPGTACNQQTGYCERLPCGGKCMPGEVCERKGFTERCVENRQIVVNPEQGDGGTR